MFGGESLWHQACKNSLCQKWPKLLRYNGVSGEAASGARRTSNPGLSYGENWRLTERRIKHLEQGVVVCVCAFHSNRVFTSLVKNCKQNFILCATHFHVPTVPVSHCPSILASPFRQRALACILVSGECVVQVQKEGVRISGLVHLGKLKFWCKWSAVVAKGFCNYVRIELRILSFSFWSLHIIETWHARKLAAAPTRQSCGPEWRGAVVITGGVTGIPDQKSLCCWRFVPATSKIRSFSKNYVATGGHP